MSANRTIYRTHAEEAADAGLDLLALFSPIQVQCIAEAVNQYGLTVTARAEARQVENCYLNDALAFIPMHLGSDVRQSICRAASAILMDACVEDWSEDEYQDCLEQVFMIEAPIADEYAKRIKTDADTALVRFLKDGWLDLGPIDNLAYLAAKGVDDLVDKALGTLTNDNLFEFKNFGDIIMELNVRAKLMKHQVLTLKGRQAQNSVPGFGTSMLGYLQNQIVSNQGYRSPGEIANTLVALKALTEGVRSGVVEPAAPNTPEGGDPLEKFLRAAGTDDSIPLKLDELLHRLLRLATRKSAPQENGDWMSAFESLVNVGTTIAQGVHERRQQEREFKNIQAQQELAAIEREFGNLFPAESASAARAVAAELAPREAKGTKKFDDSVRSVLKASADLRRGPRRRSLSNGQAIHITING